MTKCSRCGDCCEAIPFQRTKKMIDKHLAESVLSDKNEYSLKFIKKYWRRISRKKFVAIHPEAANTSSPYFYTCLKFDAVARLCMAHDERPAICSDYPWYDIDPVRQEFHGIPARCSFWEDVSEERRPVWVKINVKPR